MHLLSPRVCAQLWWQSVLVFRSLLHFFCVWFVCTCTKYLAEEALCLKFSSRGTHRCWAQGSIILSVGVGKKEVSCIPGLGKSWNWTWDILGIGKLCWVKPYREMVFWGIEVSLEKQRLWDREYLESWTTFIILCYVYLKMFFFN